MVIVGHCPHCGAPIYAPDLWMSVTPPPPMFTCNCVQHTTTTTTTGTAYIGQAIERE